MYKALDNIFQDAFVDTGQQSNTVDYVDSQANSGQANVAVSNGAQFAVGDQVIVYDGLDTFETATILNINVNTITMTAPLANTYPPGSRIGRYLGYLDTVNNKFQRLLAPDLGDGTDGAFVSNGNANWNSDKNFMSVTIQNGHTITVIGNIQIKCQGAFVINAGGKLSSKGQGHAGGNGGLFYGIQGTSYPGGGSNTTSANGGGGGGGYGTGGTGWWGTGGGGGYGTGGGGGSNFPGGNNAAGGGTYNDPALSNFATIYLYGSGGGGGAGTDNGAQGYGHGGYGGGIIRVHCKTLTVQGEIDCDGGAVLNPVSANYEIGAPGGGSGGTIFIQAVQLVTAGASLIHASGSPGGTGSRGISTGPAGGAGRIRIEAGKITGTTTPAFATGFKNNMGGFTHYGWYTTSKIFTGEDTILASVNIKQSAAAKVNPTGATNSGQKVINILAGDTAKFSPNMVVIVYENEKLEIMTVQSVGGSSLTMVANFANSYTVAATIVRIDAVGYVSLIAPGANESFQIMTLKEANNLGNDIWGLVYHKTFKVDNMANGGVKLTGRVMLSGKSTDTVDVNILQADWAYY